MDEKTYSNPEIATAINEDFIPIRVDIDKRPDISERYNRGGFPTTAFLSDRGESIWGATFVPPVDMKRIMEAILSAKGSGEIEKALARSRQQPDEIGGGHERKPIDSDQLSGVFEDIFTAYDVEFGGFGIEPKFPHPDMVDLLLIRHIESGEDSLLEAATNSIVQMASGLHDKVEGGVFRYSVTRDWKTPHYEKMLETNTSFLRNLIHAHSIVADRGFDILAEDIARYILNALHDIEGGFYGSQDADEAYYGLDLTDRRRRKAPSIDKTVYAGWNTDACSAFILAGTVLRDDRMIKAAESSWNYTLENLWNPRLELVRHVAKEETYLFEDQVSFLGALLAQLALSKDESKIALAERLIRGVDRAFANPEGGYNDVMRNAKAIGELDTPRRPLVENSNWALELARFGALLHSHELVQKSRGILDSFVISEVEANGVFAAAYLRARWALDRGMRTVEIHANAGVRPTDNLLLATALAYPDPTITTTSIAEDGLAEPYTLICTESGCSPKIGNPDDLRMLLRGATRC